MKLIIGENERGYGKIKGGIGEKVQEIGEECKYVGEKEKNHEEDALPSDPLQPQPQHTSSAAAAARLPVCLQNGGVSGRGVAGGGASGTGVSAPEDSEDSDNLLLNQRPGTVAFNLMFCVVRACIFLGGNNTFFFANIFTLFTNFLHFLANTPLNFAIPPPFLATISFDPKP